jgi:hypothetical protein
VTNAFARAALIALLLFLCAQTWTHILKPGMFAAPAATVGSLAPCQK